ncbi:MAG: class I SAM-dependent methyltransferase [Nitrospinae bacterium]|nr:class I SAM-dependent methyltransferase [Nitrospinota bacterium]
MNSNKIKEKVSSYYTHKLNKWGPTPQGVDWNSRESQEIRFDQLLKICDTSKNFTINDLGCGYGALYVYMTEQSYDFEYFGYDLSEGMIEKAHTLYKDAVNCRFTQSDILEEVDYTTACGLFNVKMDVDPKDWEEYVLEVLEKIDRASQRGFAFNILTRYSDPEYKKDHLYYADPYFYFDFCKKKFSKHVALLHDYPLYEFSILVRKDI